MRLWEYERQEYLGMLYLPASEVGLLKEERFRAVEGAQLLLALNCEKPSSSFRFQALYQYRCRGRPLSLISSFALEDPYILAFVKDEDKERALYYLHQYQAFLSSLKLSGKGIPVGADVGEYVGEITYFLESGGIGSNKFIKPTH